ncbi:MAG: DUF2752 domain-containing protein [Eubacteriales bacterium]
MWKRIYEDLLQYKVGILVGGIYYVAVKVLFQAFCPMVLVTGLPCPGCGMTRAMLYLAQGEWVRAYNLQPSSFLFAIAGIYCVLMRYVLGRKIAGLKIIIVILSILLLGNYLYRMTMVFPSHAPMTYRSNNLLSTIIPGYRNILQSMIDYVTIWRTRM